MPEQEPLKVRVARALGTWPLDPNRCDRCGWPLGDDPCSCKPGNCSMRPMPAPIECPDYPNDPAFVVGVIHKYWLGHGWSFDGSITVASDRGDIDPSLEGEGPDLGTAVCEWFVAYAAAGGEVKR